MLSKKAIKYFKENGHSFEEIEGIKLGLEQLDRGETLTEEEVFGNLDKKIKSNMLSNV